MLDGRDRHRGEPDASSSSPVTSAVAARPVDAGRTRNSSTSAQLNCTAREQRGHRGRAPRRRSRAASCTSARARAWCRSRAARARRPSWRHAFGGRRRRRRAARRGRSVGCVAGRAPCRASGTTKPSSASAEADRRRTAGSATRRSRARGAPARTISGAAASVVASSAIHISEEVVARAATRFAAARNTSARTHEATRCRRSSGVARRGSRRRRRCPRKMGLIDGEEQPRGRVDAQVAAEQRRRARQHARATPRRSRSATARDDQEQRRRARGRAADQRAPRRAQRRERRRAASQVIASASPRRRSALATLARGERAQVPAEQQRRSRSGSAICATCIAEVASWCARRRARTARSRSRCGARRPSG